MKFASLPLAAKIGAGVAGALLVAGGAAALTAAATGARPQSGAQAAATPAPNASPASLAPAQKASGTAQKTIHSAVLRAEAQVLGTTPKAMQASLKGGTTVQVLAGRMDLDQAAFSSRLTQALQPILDQGVQSGTISTRQEQATLKRVAAAVPNWDKVGAGKPGASPTPSAAQQ